MEKVLQHKVSKKSILQISSIKSFKQNISLKQTISKIFKAGGGAYYNETSLFTKEAYIIK